MVYIGNPEEAIKYFKRSIMLDPLHKSTGRIGVSYFTMGDYDKGVKYIEKELKDYPARTLFYAFLASSCAFLGNDIKAKKAFKDWRT